MTEILFIIVIGVLAAGSMIVIKSRTKDQRNAFFFVSLIGFMASLPYMYGAVTEANNLYGIAVTFATAIISYSCFSKLFKDSNLGIVSSALYVFSIFRIYKLHIRGEIGEGAALMFLPLVVGGLYGILAEEDSDSSDKNAWIFLAAGFVGLIYTDTATCMITVLTTLMVCIFLIPRFLCKKVWLAFVKALAVTAITGGWYLVRSVRACDIAVDTIQQRGLLPVQLFFHFWKDQNAQALSPVGVGFVLMAVLILFFIMWFSGAFTAEKDRKLSFVKVVACESVLLLTMSLQHFPWDRIQRIHPRVFLIVSNMSFPDRFLGGATIFIIIINGFLMDYFAKKHKVIYWLMLIAVLLSVTTSGMYMLDYIKVNQI